MERIKILLVDDHQIILDGIRLMLDGESDIRIIASASDATEALRYARELFPDIIIADISMPGMNGIDFTEKIRKEGLRAKIIILSMHSSEEYICSMVKAGANGYLTKQGTTRVELLNAVRMVMKGEDYFSPEVLKIIMKKYVAQAKKGSIPELKPVSLTAREKEILKLYAEGFSNHEIAETLCISVKTVDAHKNNIMQKFDFKSTVDMVKYAIRSHLVDL